MVSDYYQKQVLENSVIEFSMQTIMIRRFICICSVILMIQPILLMNQFSIGNIFEWQKLESLTVESVAFVFSVLTLFFIILSGLELRLMWKYLCTSVTMIHSRENYGYNGLSEVQETSVWNKTNIQFGLTFVMDILLPALLMGTAIAYWSHYMC